MKFFNAIFLIVLLSLLPRASFAQNPDAVVKPRISGNSTNNQGDKPRNPTSASVGKFSIGAEVEGKLAASIPTFGQAVSLSSNGQTLPNQNGSAVAGSHDIKLYANLFEVQNMRSVGQIYNKANPLEVGVRFEGALGAGLGVSPKGRHCGFSVLALFGIDLHGKIPPKSLAEKTYSDLELGVGVDAGGQLYLACLAGDTTINVGPKAILTSSAIAGASVRNGIAVSAPGEMVGGSVRIIRDSKTNVIIELLGRVNELTVKGIDSRGARGEKFRAKIIADTRIKGILGLGLEGSLRAPEFKLRGLDARGEAVASVVW